MKAVTVLNSHTYEGRLQELCLDSLEERRKKGDMIIAFKVQTGKNNVDPPTWFATLDQGAGSVTGRKAGHLQIYQNGMERLEGTSDQFKSVRTH